MAEEDDKHLTGRTLSWLQSPLVSEFKQHDHGDFDPLQDIASSAGNATHMPRFQKRSAPTNAEMFYDLWFVANIAIFTSQHSINDLATLRSYIGYISVLWSTWLLATLYDVRYLTDSVTSRLILAVQAGVMIGFAVVAVQFTPDEQIKSVFQATSLILMVSRLLLALQYSIILWHVRHFKDHGRRPFAITVAFCLIAAIIYLGVSFRFTDAKNSRAYVTWYVVAAFEVLSHLGLSLFFRALTFDGTYLTERIAGSTLFMLGEGVNGIAENVVTIVSNNGWNSATIGGLTSGIATIYFVFMTYFDWIANHDRLKGIPLLLWTILHYPFHVLMLLFMEGLAQFLIMFKVIEALLKSFNSFVDKIGYASDTESLVGVFNSTANQLWSDYPSSYIYTSTVVDKIIANVSTFPDAFWTGDQPVQNADELSAWWTADVNDFISSISNAVFITYKVQGTSDLGTNSTVGDGATDAQNAAVSEVYQRLDLTFVSTFITAGLTLVFLVFLHSLMLPRRSWTLVHGVRVGVIVLTAIALGLLSLLDSSVTLHFVTTAWPLPTLSLIFFIVVIVTHFPHAPPTSSMLFFGRSHKHDASSADNGVSFTQLEQQRYAPADLEHQSHYGYDGNPARNIHQKHATITERMQD
ncbi:hypothetical protein F5Y18DRAFT_436769 [Xylariaceae sp. FL1019]|nr:hypothetical protein F5Y18DRAFT_436769 [Xylariaceae sp. FL1019]